LRCLNRCRINDSTGYLYVFFPASRYSVFKDQIYSPALIFHQLGVANLSTFFSASSFFIRFIY